MRPLRRLRAFAVISAAGIGLSGTGSASGAASRINFAHLDALRVELASGKTTWAAAWQPVRRGVGGPGADPETGLLTRTEDLARIALCYLDAPRGTTGSLAKAREALEWLLILGGPDGNFAEGLDSTGSPAGDRGFEWRGGRSLWAMASGARRLPAKDSLVPRLRAACNTIRDTLADSPPGLIDGSSAETSLAVLGLIEMLRGRRDQETVALLSRYLVPIAESGSGDGGTYPFHAHLPTINPTLWHAYGAYQVAALVEAGKFLGDRVWITEAEHEAASWTVHVLVSGGPIWGFSPMPRPYPQIPYNLEPQVRGLLALYRATGKESYGQMAGLFAAWLHGDNPVGKPVYDPATGQVRDGIDPRGMAAGSGAEATTEGLATLLDLASNPELEKYTHAREVASKRAIGVRPPGLRSIKGSGPYAGLDFAPLGADQRLVIRPGVEGPTFVSPVYLKGMAPASSSGALEIGVSGWKQRFPVEEPASSKAEPVLEIGHAFEPVELRSTDRVTVGLIKGTSVPIALDGIVLQPAVEYRAWSIPRGKIALVKSFSPLIVPLQYVWPGASVMTFGLSGKQMRAGEDLEPYGFALIESGS